MIMLMSATFILFLYLESAAAADDFTLMLRDDFNGDSLDLTKWNPANVRSTVSYEQQYYIPSALSVGGGVLKLTASCEGVVGKCNYTSGRVDTRLKFKFKYGVIEWRAKLPSGGAGIWPSLALEYYSCLPAVPCDDWPPAVSVVSYRADQPKTMVCTVFYKDAAGAVQSHSKSYDFPEDLSHNFHVYRLHWNESRLEWLVDGNSVFFTDDRQSIPTEEMQVTMAVAVGGAEGQAPDKNTKLPAELLIDYVSVQQFTGKSAGNGATATPAYLAPLLGTLIPVVVIALCAAVLVILWKKRGKIWKHGDMRKGSGGSTLATEWASNYAKYLVCDDEKGEQAVQHYINLLEIPSANLEISDRVLGSGEYGVVRRGTARGLWGEPKPTVVAVKSVKNSLDEEQCRSLVEEMKMMTRAGRHLNILNLLGCVIKGETLLLTEYCHSGSLLTYLTSHRGDRFLSHVDPDGQLLALDENALLDRQKTVMMHPSAPSKAFDGKAMTTNDLISFSFQVSRGMAYLASRSIIHRDLAARNVLVDEERIMKISDFGMARQKEEYVLENQQVALPVCWMPPEAIARKVFSQKSDVWSFGILTWEIFTLGETPYKNAGLSSYVQEFAMSLSQGFRMKRPEFCPLSVYDIMQKCWLFEATKRPTFLDLEGELRALIEPGYMEAYLALDVPYERFNAEHQNILDEVAVHSYNESEQL